LQPYTEDTPRTVLLSYINKLSLQYFLREFRRSSKAQEYVYARISPETAKLFYVGYAPSRGLAEYLNEHDVQEVDARAIGILSFDLEGNAYGKFYNRVMLPIIHGVYVAGFGGRTVKGIEPKYLNSKESILYKKREILFGVPQTRKYIRKRGCCFLVEGYFDVMTPFDYGLKNCLASCGTALTKQQAHLLKRYTKKVYVMYDGDAAGRAAAKKARRILKKSKIYAGTITLPHSLDPASYFEKYGRAGIRKLRKYVKK